MTVRPIPSPSKLRPSTPRDLLGNPPYFHPGKVSNFSDWVERVTLTAASPVWLSRTKRVPRAELTQVSASTDEPLIHRMSGHPPTHFTLSCRCHTNAIPCFFCAALPQRGWGGDLRLRLASSSSSSVMNHQSSIINYQSSDINHQS